MYPVFETICLRDKQIQNLSLHQQRMDQTSMHLWGASRNRAHIWQQMEEHAMPGLVKCRLLYNQHHEIWTYQSYTPRTVKSLIIIEDPEIRYPYKFTERKCFEHWRTQLNLNETEEIIFTRNGFILETTYSNLVFSKGDSWFTPDNCLLQGTKRQLLLNKGLLQKQSIHLQDLNNYQRVGLINAMLDPGDMLVSVSAIRYRQNI